MSKARFTYNSTSDLAPNFTPTPTPTLTRSARFQVDPVRRVSRWLRGFVVLGLATVGLVGGTATFAASHGGPTAMPPTGAATPRHEGRGGPAMALLTARGLERALDRIEANPEQRAQIRRLAGAARDELRDLRRESRPLREQMRAAWARPTLDEGEIERLRQQMQAQQDRISRRATQAMIEVGRVLSPAQRQKLAEWAPRMHPPGREGPMRHRHGLAPGGSGAPEALHDD